MFITVKCLNPGANSLAVTVRRVLLRASNAPYSRIRKIPDHLPQAVACDMGIRVSEKEQVASGNSCQPVQRRVLATALVDSHEAEPSVTNPAQNFVGAVVGSVRRYQDL